MVLALVSGDSAYGGLALHTQAEHSDGRNLWWKRPFTSYQTERGKDLYPPMRLPIQNFLTPPKRETKHSVHGPVGDILHSKPNKFWLSVLGSFCQPVRN